MDWEDVPKQNRQQLMSILGEMAQNYLRTIQSLQKEINHGNSASEDKSQHIKQNTHATS